MRACTVLVFAAAVGIGAGCESIVYSYDCRGKLLNSDGTPAAGVLVQLESSPLTPGSVASSEADVTETVATLPDGQFRVFCVGDVYTSWLGFRESPTLQHLDLWFKRNAAWERIPLRLTPDEQQFFFDGNREILLPPLTLPSATTRPSSSAPTLGRFEMPNGTVTISGIPLQQENHRVGTRKSWLSDCPVCFNAGRNLSTRSRHVGINTAPSGTVRRAANLPTRRQPAGALVRFAGLGGGGVLGSRTCTVRRTHRILGDGLSGRRCTRRSREVLVVQPRFRPRADHIHE